MRYTFDELLSQAAVEAGGPDAPTRPAILKELLHYDILLAISRSDVNRRLVFQGGTALRLCYGGQRYSEDLDFTCGADAVEPFNLEDVESLLRAHVADRYGLAMDLVVPKPGVAGEFGTGQVAVKRWVFVISVPGFAAAQRIHIEICNVPSYEVMPTLIQPRYHVLGDVYGDIALRVESLNEILADKIVALIARRHTKARDVWDLRWLTQRGLTPDIGLIRLKFRDYRVSDIPARTADAIARLRSGTARTSFVSEMTRFVTPTLGRRLQEDTDFARAWLEHAHDQLLSLTGTDWAIQPRS